MATFSCDIETNGFNPDTIWCIVFQNVETLTYTKFTPHFLHKVNDWMYKHVDTIVFHNGYGFDVPVMENLLNTDFTNIQIEDTLIMAQLDSPNREGGNSLDSLGGSLGYPKGEHTDWSCFSPEMLKYCVRDVEITTKVYHWMLELNLSRDALELEYATKVHCHKQEVNGWRFDIVGAVKLLQGIEQTITEVEDKVREVFKPLPVFNPVNPTPKLNKSGSKSSRYIKQMEKGCKWINNEWGYNTYPEFNLGSRRQIARYLKYFGWKPTVFTKGTLEKHKEGLITKDELTAQVDETILEGVEIPEAKLIARFLMLQKRESMLRSWIEAYNEQTDSIHCRVHILGTVTNRMSCSNPNLQQVVANTKEYGTEMRALFIAPEGMVLVGADLAGLELRCLAHYMKDTKYIDEVLHGDIHTANQKAAGLKTRSEAKTFIYAYLYGGGDALIGRIVGGGYNEGKKIKQKFLDNTPALSKLRKNVEEVAAQGFVKGIDGRHINIRSSHSALNFLLQSAGAIIAKRAWVIFNEKCTLPYNQVGVIHDELQLVCKPGDADAIGKQVVKAMVEAGEYYNTRCPMDGEYSIGKNWAETH